MRQQRLDLLLRHQRLALSSGIVWRRARVVLMGEREWPDILRHGPVGLLIDVRVLSTMLKRSLAPHRCHTTGLVW